MGAIHLAGLRAGAPHPQPQSAASYWQLLAPPRSALRAAGAQAPAMPMPKAALASATTSWAVGMGLFVEPCSSGDEALFAQTSELFSALMFQ